MRGMYSCGSTAGLNLGSFCPKRRWVAIYLLNLGAVRLNGPAGAVGQYLTDLAVSGVERRFLRKHAEDDDQSNDCALDADRHQGVHAVGASQQAVGSRLVLKQDLAFESVFDERFLEDVEHSVFIGIDAERPVEPEGAFFLVELVDRNLFRAHQVSGDLSDSFERISLIETLLQAHARRVNFRLRSQSLCGLIAYFAAVLFFERNHLDIPLLSWLTRPDSSGAA